MIYNTGNSVARIYDTIGFLTAVFPGDRVCKTLRITGGLTRLGIEIGDLSVRTRSFAPLRRAGWSIEITDYYGFQTSLVADKKCKGS